VLALESGCERQPAGADGLDHAFPNDWSFDFIDERKMSYVAAHMDSLMQCTRSVLQL
jgi:hypothetical protein